MEAIWKPAVAHTEKAPPPPDRVEALGGLLTSWERRLRRLSVRLAVQHGGKDAGEFRVIRDRLIWRRRASAISCT